MLSELRRADVRTCAGHRALRARPWHDSEVEGRRHLSGDNAEAVDRADYVLARRSRRNIWANADVPELGEGVFGDVRLLNYQPIAVERLVSHRRRSALAGVRRSGLRR